MNFMRYLLAFLLSFLTSQQILAQSRVLVFCETEGFVHETIDVGTQALQQIGREEGFETTVSRDSAFFTENDLDPFDLIIFFHTTGNVLNSQEESRFQNYIENGGNFFGIHSAASTEYSWSWYGDLVGAYFKGHPEVQKAVLNVEDPQNLSVKHLQPTWERVDEWYNFKEMRPGLNVILTIDERTYKGGEHGDFHPVAWYQNLPSGGKSVYTGLGHTLESFSDPDFLAHLKGCIRFALLD
ncbi:MAG: ThuA domain-containing protein [Gramella sp.]|nr:ThuA domain-containing protein [Christiangramia sp.]